jgi:hypothetical protein
MSPGFRVWQTKPTQFEITQDLSEDEVWLDAEKKSSLTKTGNQLTAAFFESGVVLNARVNHYRNQYYINFRLLIPKLEFSRRTRGLLGTLDDDRTNDLYRRNADNPLPNTISEREIFEHFKTCK